VAAAAYRENILTDNAGFMQLKTKRIIINISIAVLGLIVIGNICFQLYRIPTTSMVPSLMPGDYIFANRLVYGLRIPFTHKRILQMQKPRRGDIAVFRAPGEGRKVYVKRLIATGGERVQLLEGNIYINGKEIVEPAIARNYYYNQGTYGTGQDGAVVPDKAYFFLGDNSISSADSRFWGFASEDDVIGKAIFIWWPPARISMIE